MNTVKEIKVNKGVNKTKEVKGFVILNNQDISSLQGKNEMSAFALAAYYQSWFNTEFSKGNMDTVFEQSSVIAKKFGVSKDYILDLHKILIAKGWMTIIAKGRKDAKVMLMNTSINAEVTAKLEEDYIFDTNSGRWNKKGSNLRTAPYKGGNKKENTTGGNAPEAVEKNTPIKDTPIQKETHTEHSPLLKESVKGLTPRVEILVEESIYTDIDGNDWTMDELLAESSLAFVKDPRIVALVLKEKYSCS